MPGVAWCWPRRTRCARPACAARCRWRGRCSWRRRRAASLGRLPVGRLWGVGPKAEARLRAMSITTIGDLARAGAAALQRRLGDAGRELWSLAQGIDPRPVVPDREAKSIGAEDTFEE